MKKAVLLVLLILTTAQAITATYTSVVAENGNSRTFLVLAGQGIANIPLPLDADNPLVEGALYLQATNGIDVNIGTSEKAVITFDSSLLTEKRGAEWTFTLLLSNIESSSVTLTLPPNAVVTGTAPIAEFQRSERALSIIWDNPTEKVSVNYSFQETPVVLPTEQPKEIEQPDSFPILLISFITFLIILAVLVYFYIYKKKGSESKENVLKTLSENEHLVMNLLIKNQGAMKRNKLEKSSELAKSSLASTLHQLEKKNLLHVKKDSTVHFVEVSDFFKSL